MLHLIKPTTLARHGEVVALFNFVSGRLVQDGGVITFRTDGPVALPLPNRELCSLQNFFIRVLRMAGRAGWDMREMNVSDSDVDSICADDMPRELRPSSATTPISTGGKLAPPQPDTSDSNGRPSAPVQVVRPPAPEPNSQRKLQFFHRRLFQLKRSL